MRARLVRLLGTLILAALAACTNPSSEARPVFKTNSGANDNYEIALNFDNAPGEFESIKGYAQYSVINHSCLPAPRGASGMPASIPMVVRPFTFIAAPEGQLLGKVQTDLMSDEDYYGRGVCRWQLQEVRVDVRANESEGMTEFVSSLSAEALTHGKATATYHQRRLYPGQVNTTGKKSFGQQDKSKLSPSISDRDLFIVTISPRKVIRE